MSKRNLWKMLEDTNIKEKRYKKDSSMKIEIIPSTKPFIYIHYIYINLLKHV